MLRMACVLTALAVLLGGCVSGQDATSGAIRFANAVPDAARMNLYVDARIRAQGYDFGTGTAYVAVPAGSHDVRIAMVTPGVDNDPAEPVLSDALPEVNVSLGVNDELTILMIGNVGAFQALQIPTRTTIVPTGKTRVQFAHAAVGGEPLDVFLTEPGATLNASTPRQVTALAYQAVTEQADVDAGTVRIVLTPAGHPETILLDTGPVFFGAGATFLIAAVPNVGFDATTHPYSLLVLTGRGSGAYFHEDTPASVRFVNASPGNYTLDAFVNDTTVNDTARQDCDGVAGDTTKLEACALPLGSVGSFQVITPGAYDIKLQKTGDAALPARTSIGTFAAGSQLTLLFSGLIGATATDTAVGVRSLAGVRRVSQIAQLRILDESFAAAAAIEGDPTTDYIELYLTKLGEALDDATPLIAGLRVGSDTGYLPLYPASYQLTVAKSDTATPDAAPQVLLSQQVQLASSGIYTLVIADSAGGVAPIRFLSLDDDPSPP